jgi:bifunctional UDP-N-acetylglucosamine pyrophosphorylase / glucosamine-1-phosphate N-acetyltransferase
MQAVILAAGEGCRMHPLTNTRPKVMLPLAGKPLLEHLLVTAIRAGISDFIFIVGYHDEIIRGYFGDGRGWNVNIRYCSQKKQLGTANAIRMAQPLLSGSFIVMNGDIMVKSEDISAIMAAGNTTMAVYPVSDPTGLGVAEVKGGRLVRIHEKTDNPPGNLANTGMYCFTPEVHDVIDRTARSPRGEYEITSTLNLMAGDGQPVNCQTIGSWLDISYPWDMLAVNESLMAAIETCIDGEIEDNVKVHGNIRTGSGSIVRSGCYIEGPVIIGDDCKIGPNCYLRPNTVIGNNCHVGAAVEVKNSIIMNGTKIPHHNYIGDSVIGENCNFGAGTKIANLRLDKLGISVGEIATGRRKLGAIIGDNVETGINASINVGTIIGNNALIGPGAVASGLVQPGARIF